MRKSLLFSVALLMFVIFAFPLIYTNSSQVVLNTDKKVTYDLPYAGILPDNPLYFLKAARDRGMEITTRDNTKKTELYLLLSDKRAEMSERLAAKGKYKLAITTLSKGEKYFLKIPDLVIAAKKQGTKPTDEFIYKLKMSNEKHKEVIDALIKQAPQGETAALEQVLQLNQEIARRLAEL